MSYSLLLSSSGGILVDLREFVSVDFEAKIHASLYYSDRQCTIIKDVRKQSRLAFLLLFALISLQYCCIIKSAIHNKLQLNLPFHMSSHEKCHNAQAMIVPSDQVPSPLPSFHPSWQLYGEETSASCSGLRHCLRTVVRLCLLRCLARVTFP